MAKSPLYEIIDGSGNSPYFVGADGLSLVGSGGGADVFRIGGASGVALKIYRAPALTDWTKINYQVAHPIYKNGRPAKSQYNFAWPNGIIRLDEKNVGITLPYIDRKTWISLDCWTEPRLLKKLSPENSSLSRRLAILRNLSKQIANLHARHIAVIDLRPSNVLVHVGTGDVCLIDCDSFRIEVPDGGVFPGSHVSAGYIIPEAIGLTLNIKSLNKEQDLYALAVIAFQILNYGIHPFQCILIDKKIEAGTDDEKARLGLYAYGLSPSASIMPLRQSVHLCWPPDIRQTFSKLFEARTVRPSARKWHSVFNKILFHKGLERCKKHPTDPRHIHFEDLNCAECVREKVISEIKVKASAATPKTTAVSRPSVPPPPPSQEKGCLSPPIIFLGAVIIFFVLVFLFAIKNDSTSNNSEKPAPQAQPEEWAPRSSVEQEVSPQTPPPKPAQARVVDSFEEAISALDRKDYATAKRIFSDLSAQGNASAQFALGFMYNNGRGVAQDDVEAARLYGLAAAQGDSRAQHNLGLMYAKGTGVAQDDIEAARLYGLAAAQGAVLAQYNLGLMYAEGMGVAQDDMEAARLFRLAAAQGNASAQFALGFMYNKGRGVAQDDVEAARLYGLAAAQGDSRAQYNLGLMYAKGTGVAQDDIRAHMWWTFAAASDSKEASTNLNIVAAKMPPAQIAEAQEMARKCQASNFKQCD